MPRFSEDDIRKYQDRLAGRRAENILAWAVEMFWPDMLMTSGFGPNSVCVIHMLRNLQPDLPVIFIDTTYHFPETLEVMNHYRLDGVNVRVMQPPRSKEVLDEHKRAKLFRIDPDLCCEIHKTNVFRKVLRPGSCWVAPLRKSSSCSRRHIKEFEQLHDDMVRVCPLANWTVDDIWTYIRKHRLRYNKLHDQSYTSIGCQPCTEPTVDGEDERSGRWRGRSKVECGLHTFFLEDNSQATQDAVESELAN